MLQVMLKVITGSDIFIDAKWMWLIYCNSGQNNFCAYHNVAMIQYVARSEVHNCPPFQTLP